MKYNDYADQLNRHGLIKKAKETDYNNFLAYCSSEIGRVEKMKIPTKIDGRSQLLEMKRTYLDCLKFVDYVVGTGDIKPSSEIVNRNIAKVIVEYYENEGYLPSGTTEKFNG